MVEKRIPNLPSVCCHKWRIETPNGEKSQGVCRSCGVSRTFRNGLVGHGFAEGYQEPHTRTNSTVSAVDSYFDKMELRRATWDQ